MLINNITLGATMITSSNTSCIVREHQRYVCFNVQAKTAGGSSLVTSLSTLGNTVLACSFMLSLSLFSTKTYQGKAGLEPLAANISLLDSNGDAHHDVPIQVQTAGLLNGQFLLAGAYPDGLLLLERDVAQEVASCEARQRERERKQSESELSLKTRWPSTLGMQWRCACLDIK